MENTLLTLGSSQRLDVIGTPPANDEGDGAVEPSNDQDATAQRLHYLFRRSQHEDHVLKRALFDYRGVPLS